MKEKLESLGVGLSAATIALVPNLLQNTNVACTGICGSCGGGCSGMIFGMGAGGLIFITKRLHDKKEK